jgi:hypothetical protein
VGFQRKGQNTDFDGFEQAFDRVPIPAIAPDSG